MIPSEILNQDCVWVDRHGEEHLLDEMEPSYRANLIPFLRGNVCTLYRLCHRGVSELDGSLSPQACEEWLVHTPLMRRLLELVRQMPFEERQKIHEANRAYEELTGYQKVRFG